MIVKDETKMLGVMEKFGESDVNEQLSEFINGCIKANAVLACGDERLVENMAINVTLKHGDRVTQHHFEINPNDSHHVESVYMGTGYQTKPGQAIELYHQLARGISEELALKTAGE